MNRNMASTETAPKPLTSNEKGGVDGVRSKEMVQNTNNLLYELA